MTRFCTRNISTLFGVQFLSFAISMAEKCFGRILTTFSGPSPTEHPKLKTGPKSFWFAPETYRDGLWCNSYRFLSVRLKNVSVIFWRLFQARVPLQQAKVEIGLGWLRFAPVTYPHYFGNNFYRFPSVWLKNVSVEFWRLLRTWVSPQQAKLKIGPIWLGLALEIHPHYLTCISYRLVLVWLKNVLVKFCWLLRTQVPPRRQSWKLGLYDSVLQRKYTHIIWDAFLIISHPYGGRMPLSNFDAFFGSEHHRSRKS